ncbi:MAG: hypothetical protein GX660_05735 [Clostridiaceae bacterium]|nr:hypothetical protein [Clostridiaceae bacterium]
MKKILVMLIMGLLPLITPLVAYADVSSIHDPVPELDNYTLAEVFSNTEQPLTNYIMDDLNALDTVSSFDHNLVTGGVLTDNFDESHEYYLYYDGSTQSYAMPESLKGIDSGTLIDCEQLVTNGDFSDGTTGWTLPSATGSVSDGIYSFTPTAQFGGLQQLTTITSGIKYYIISRIKASSGDIRLYIGVDEVYILSNETGSYETISGIIEPTINSPTIKVKDFSSSSWTQIEVDYIFTFNISNLIANKQYSPLYSTTFDLMSDAEIKAQMDLWVSYYDEWQDKFDHIVIDLTELFGSGTEPSDAQMEKYHAFYLDPTQTGFIDLDPLQVYVNADGNYNITMLESNKIYSPLNLDMFDNLTESEQELQFNQWAFRDIESEKVLSFNYFSSLFPLLTLADMIIWYNAYIDLLEVDELAYNTIDDTEKMILIIALILYIIGVFIALYTKNKIVFVGSSLLWFIPIVMIPNLFIVVFSTIMFISSILIAYYPKKESDFE